MRRRLLAGMIGLIGALCSVAAGCGGDDDETAKRDGDAQTRVGVEAPGIIAFRRYADAAETRGIIFTIRPDGTDERQVTRPPDGADDEFPQVRRTAGGLGGSAVPRPGRATSTRRRSTAAAPSPSR